MAEVRIDRLGHKGDGIAPGPVLVPRCLPGEWVAGKIENGRIADPRVVVPVPERVAPPCRHYGTCGGCALQHADDGFVASWKSAVVEQALAAQGLSGRIVGISTSPARGRRRATLHGRRTKRGALVGFHGRASDLLTEVPDCQLLHPDILALLPAFEALTVTGASRKGELDIAVTTSAGGADVAVRGGKPLDEGLRTELAEWLGTAGIARLTWNDELIAQARAPIQIVGRTTVTPPPGAFLQATAEGEAALIAAVRRAVGGASRIVDLFAGCGTFTLPLAEAADVHAVEGDADMLDALDAGWRRGQGLRRVTIERRDLFRRPLLPDELNSFEAAVVDPPRAGAEAQCDALAASRLSRLAMVSCNPVTFARDARILSKAGWQIDWIALVDQFRWSPHVELAAAFVRPHMAG